MASTYSTNLGIELIGTGDQSGSWGTTTNRNLGTLIEEAICGYASVAITDSTTATTISISNGATSSARHFVLELTGTLTANRTLVVPTIEKPYLIYNNTVDGFSVTVKTLTGIGVTIPHNAKRWVMVDGTNVVDMLTDLPSGATVNGSAILTASTGSYNGANATFTGTVTGGILAAGNGTVGNPSISFTSDPNTGIYRTAEGSTGISSNGTLRADFNTTGTSLTGTFSVSGAATLGSTLSVSGTSTFTGLATFNGGTAMSSATVTNSLGVGTTLNVTGAAALGSTLTVGGNFTATGLASFANTVTTTSAFRCNGSVSVPAYSFVNAPTTGMYWDSANSRIGWAYAGVDRMTLSSSALNLGVTLVAGAISASSLAVSGTISLGSILGGLSIPNGVVTCSRTDGSTNVTLSNYNAGGGFAWMIFQNNGVGLAGSINYNGVGGTVFNTGSDGRLKPVRQDFDSGSIIDALAPVYHNWTFNANAWTYGLIAQEVHEHVPQAVTVGKGEPEDEDFVPWQMDYSKLVPILWREIRELRKRVADLEG